MSSKKWKDAATLIIAARNPFHKNNCANDSAVNRDVYDYKILTIKRSNNSSFMPETFVFPGGHTEDSDACLEWLDLYSECGVNIRKLTELNNEIKSGPRDIFHSNSSGKIHQLISLRISAIRETFEECGLMLCKRRVTSQSEVADSWCSYLYGNETKEWQSRVQRNPSEFINACRHFQCFPDIWSLKKWSNWLTPATFSKRFNAAFFLTTVNQIPPTNADNIEVSEIKWLTPGEVQRLADAGDITVPIPQLYEVARLSNFSSAESLRHFAELRDAQPSQCWMSVHCACDDGMIFLLPGDDLYPAGEDLEARREVETLVGSVEALRAGAARLNRLESRGTRWRVVSNLGSDLAGGRVFPCPPAPAKL
ncbi:acyl-coenzyme A diphosphatase NUDT19-like [Bacillus rossius redtenbacheri]|uniref:acyl-coenzyme A diphosphatase NUDT19-like n=1 Tax=Bacillus rossius redtenbacheri TaxID=93214 RepID=UPI002FDDB553